MNRIFVRISMFAFLAFLLAVLPVTAALAAELKGGDRVTIGTGEVINDDLYLAGSSITVDGIINGDLIAVGSDITINGRVSGSILAAASNITLNGEVGGSARLAAANITVNKNIGGDLVLLTGNATVNGQVKRDVLFASGNVVINGEAGRNLRGGAGEIRIEGKVGGKVDVTAEKLIFGSSSDIKGDISYTSARQAELKPGHRIAGRISQIVPEAEKPVTKFVDGLRGWLIAYFMAFAVGILLIVLFPSKMSAVASTLKERLWPSLGWGALILFMAPLAILLVCITIIGIPVALITLALYLISIYLSQVVVGLCTGRWLMSYAKKEGVATPFLIGAFALGLLTLNLLKLVPVVNVLVSLAVIMFGIGAMVVYFQKASQTKG